MPKKSSPEKKNKKTKSAPAEDRFVTNFTTIMQRFPEYHGSILSKKDKEIVDDFFTRMTKFTEKTFTEFNPAHPLMAFLLVNFPEEILRCSCNPFRQSLIYRSTNFVGAVFQVVIDCRQDEDDDSDDFIPPSTAKNYLYSMLRFIEILGVYSAYFKSKKCQCEAKGRTSSCYYFRQALF